MPHPRFKNLYCLESIIYRFLDQDQVDEEKRKGRIVLKRQHDDCYWYLCKWEGWEYAHCTLQTFSDLIDCKPALEDLKNRINTNYNGIQQHGKTLPAQFARRGIHDGN